MDFTTTKYRPTTSLLISNRPLTYRIIKGWKELKTIKRKGLRGGIARNPNGNMANIHKEMES